MRVLLAASEVVPFSKTGGLGDVAGALPKALSRIGCDVQVVTPRYSGAGASHGDVVEGDIGHVIIDDLYVPFAGSVKYARVWQTHIDGAPIYFIDNDEYFGRGYIYGYGDFDAERFAFFSRAALELVKRLGTPPDLIHCNDWQTGFIPPYLRFAYNVDPFFRRTATLFTIHNLAYQGAFTHGLLPHIGFGSNAGLVFDFHGVANVLKAALLTSTALSTVSRKYAQEIQTPEFGNHLDGILRTRRGDLLGILNGVDYSEWDPEHDQHIPAPFSVNDLSGKSVCKRELLKEFYLPDEPDRPLIACVSRLTVQKGIDLIADAISRILDAGACFIMLGSGADHYEGFFQQVRDSRPSQVGVYFGYSTPLAHRIEAGADLFLMPSAYEPCGLNQMYSLRYGTVPVVRGVGGLEDTIENFERASGKGNGFKFYDYSAERLLEKFYEALLAYMEPDVWRRLQINGMSIDNSWDHAAQEYLDAYERVVRAHR